MMDRVSFTVSGMKSQAGFKVTGMQVRSGIRVRNEPVKMVKEYSNSDYNHLANLPSIESVELKGDRSFSDFGMSVVKNTDILNMFK
ncbi:hypothetical protein [Eubacterium pyruvativorans]|uniref:hypothetical protein n=1 Tax=Eubacterium pyruvativorans TaxID=155865 RepID=UPI00156595F6|nr:hypothetical protein [Eubacterium pyruvativorans]